MKLLLDTHCWLWSLAEPERLSSAVQDTLRDRSRELFVSAASAWEIALKHGLGKLVLPLPPEDYVPSRMASQGVTALPIFASHALRVAKLPTHHKDPFDRLLVAQAQLEGLTLLTADEQLRAYDVPILWAL